MKMSKLAAPLIFALALCASATQAAAQIVAFGHSAAHGYSPSGAYWPVQLQQMLQARGRSIQVTDMGVNGETTDQALARIQTALPAGTTLVLLAMSGHNDTRRPGGYDPRNAMRNIAAMKAYVRSRGIRLIDVMADYRSVVRRPGMTIADGIHLNDAGHREMARIVAARIR